MACGNVIVATIIVAGCGVIGSTAHALVEPNWPVGTANICRSPADGFIDFESGEDGEVVRTTVPGTQFTSTDGFDWLYADWRTGRYNGPYPRGAYTSNGNFSTWLGPSQGQGRIDFIDGPASYVSVLTSTYSGLVLDAYNKEGTLIGSSGRASPNVGTGTLTRLTVESGRGKDISYVTVHDSGNFWIMDDLCTDAAGVPPAFNAAVAFAKEVVGAPYQWGAKGYNYSVNSFASSDEARSTGYKYWNPDLNAFATGTGLDCSGLSFWAFNRTFYADKAVNWSTCTGKDAEKRCPIFYEGADGQWRWNTSKKSGAPKADDLRPGDLLFFDEIPTSGVMDHVAMYVGTWEFTQGEIYNVVHAHGWSKTDQVVPAWYDAESGKVATKSIPYDGSERALSVKGWGRISDPRLDAWVVSHSPVTLVVTDPAGQIVSVENTLADPDGYTREVAGLSYMIKAIDGVPEDTVAIPELIQGTYFIQVEPKLGSLPSDTYSLEVRFPDLGIETIWLAQQATVRRETFAVEVSANGPVTSTVLSVKIKPGDTVPCINPTSNGNIPIAVLGQSGFSVSDIDPSSIRADRDSLRDIRGVPPQRWALDDANKDGLLDLVFHFSTKELRSAGLLIDLSRLFLEGRLRDGSPTIGFDLINVVGGEHCK